VREFYELIAENMPIEMLNYSELRFDEKPISIMYNFIYQDMIRLYKIVHDGDFRSFGPGSMHIAELARWGIKNEVAGIDYMEGEEEWKRRWQNESGSTRTFAIASRQGYLVWAWNTKLRKLIIEYKI
jgi:CelD/BcsL family acetyltransferase involved in cellulose biosynthesis